MKVVKKNCIDAWKDIIDLYLYHLNRLSGDTLVRLRLKLENGFQNINVNVNTVNMA